MKNILRKFRSNLLLFACVAVAVPALAIDVPEGTDFPGSISLAAPSNGTLESGANTANGALAGSCNIGDCNPGDGLHGDTADTVRFTVPAGFQVTSYTVTTSSVVGPAGFSVTTGVAQQNTAPPPNFLFPIPTTFLVQNGTTTNLIGTPLAAGNYWFSVFGQQATAAGAFSLNWSMTINLAPVVASPADAVQDLLDLIANPLSGLVLTSKQANTLTDKLNSALSSIEAGQISKAINQLDGFVRTVQTWQKTGKVGEGTANTLIVAANAIIASLQ